MTDMHHPMPSHSEAKQLMPRRDVGATLPFLWKGILILNFLPLVVFDHLLHPAITSKVVVFFIVVQALFFFLMVKMFPQILVRFRSKATKLLAIQLFISFVAMLLSKNPLMSFLGNAGRLEGFITHVHFFLFFLLLLVLEGFGVWERILRWASVVSGIIALHVILQFFFPSLVLHGQDGSTLGNVLFASQYLLFHFFIALHLIFFGQHTQRRWKFILSAIAFLQFMSIVMLARRGILLGLVLAFVFLGFRLKKFSHEKLVRFVRGVIIGVFMLVLIGTGIMVQFRNAPWVKEIPLLTQLTSNVKTIKTRLWFIPIAFKGFVERPLLGFGQDQYEYVFLKHYDPRFLSKTADAIWNDRAHNFLLDTLIASGIAGVIILLVIMGYIAKMTWKHPLIFAAFLAYYLQALFEPDSIVTIFSFFLLLGYAVKLSEHPKLPAPSHESKVLLRLRPWAIGLSGITFIIVSLGASFYLLSNRQMMIARRSFVPVELHLFQAEFNRGYQNARFFPNLQRHYLSQISHELGVAMDSIYFLDLPAVQSLLVYLGTEFERLHKLLPNDGKLLFYGIGSRLTWARFDADQIPKAANLLEKLKAMNPSSPLAYGLEGELADIAGDKERMLKAFQKVVSLVPEGPGAHRNLGKTYLLLSQREKAIEHFKKAVDLEIEFENEAEAFFVARILAEEKAYDHLHRLYKGAVDKFPNHAELRQRLAVSYSMLGDSLNAKKHARAAMNFDPSLRASGEEFLKQLQTPTQP